MMEIFFLMYQIQADRITFSLNWSAATAVISFSLSNGENTLFHIYQIKGAFLVGHDRVLNGPLGRSKRLFTRTISSVKNHLRNRKKATLGNLEESVELSLLGNTISNM